MNSFSVKNLGRLITYLRTDITYESGVIQWNCVSKETYKKKIFKNSELQNQSPTAIQAYANRTEI